MTGSFLKRFAAAAIVNIALACMGGTAGASIITVDLNEVVSVRGPQTDYQLSVGGTPILNFSAFGGPPGVELDAYGVGGTLKVSDMGDSNPIPLSAGTVVGPSSFYASNSLLAYYSNDPGVTDGHFPGITDGYLGVSFDDPWVSGRTLYGYLLLTVTGSNDDGLVVGNLTSFTYDNSGAAITIGAPSPVPEPSALALFALGGVGLGMAGLRKRNQSTVTTV